MELTGWKELHPHGTCLQSKNLTVIIDIVKLHGLALRLGHLSNLIGTLHKSNARHLTLRNI